MKFLYDLCFKIMQDTYMIVFCKSLQGIFDRVIPLLKMVCFEGVLNCIKIDRMVNNYLSSCNV